MYSFSNFSINIGLTPSINEEIDSFHISPNFCENDLFVRSNNPTPLWLGKKYCGATAPFVIHNNESGRALGVEEKGILEQFFFSAALMVSQLCPGGRVDGRINGLPGEVMNACLAKLSTFLRYV